MEGLFKNTQNLIHDEGFIIRSKTDGSAFTRRRKLDFKSLIFSLMSFTRPGVQTELDRFFKSLSKGASFESVSKSAFTQSRRKLKPEAFIELNSEQLQYFLDNAPHQKNWKQNRVVAVDGSLLNLPHTEEVKKVFGGVKNQHEEVISARCSFAYDVCNELVLDAQIAPRRSCEKELAVNHLAQLNPQKDILVFDRGYPCQWLMGLLVQRGFKFCFRLSTAWKKAHQLMETSDDIDWTLIRSSDREWGKLKTYGLSRTLGGLRLLSIPLNHKEKEVLVTNLTDRSAYSVDDLKSLYHLRWGVEEGYKSFKKTLHIEHFTGKSPQAIRQDFHAKVFMLNMASMVRTQSVNPTLKKENYQASKTQTLAKVKDFLIDLFYGKSLKKKIKLIIELLRKRIEMIRPQRSYPRSCTSSRRRHKITNSKGI
ncbi:MAG: IS4 family transposase [Cyclobacteriaceae bacterium]